MRFCGNGVQRTGDKLYPLIKLLFWIFISIIILVMNRSTTRGKFLYWDVKIPNLYLLFSLFKFICLLFIPLSLNSTHFIFHISLVKIWTDKKATHQTNYTCQLYSLLNVSGIIAYWFEINQELSIILFNRSIPVEAMIISSNITPTFK